jgi:hypothetical protein
LLNDSFTHHYNLTLINLMPHINTFCLPKLSYHGAPDDKKNINEFYG